jgi:ketopantoate reductase
MLRHASCACRKLNPGILVMQSAQDWATKNVPGAQDLARGKPSEINFLNGYVVRKGAELGIPTPTNQALQVMVKLAERGKETSWRGG